MTPEQQRIAIAKSVGIHLHDGDHAPSNYTFVTDLPDYLNDLNAMWLVVRSRLSGAEKLRKYEANLQELSPDYPTEATAAQRSEAYLRTIGKWEGGSDDLPRKFWYAHG